MYMKFKNRQNSSIMLEIRILAPPGKEEGNRRGASGEVLSLDPGAG